jgi:hypothetical protein
MPPFGSDGSSKFAVLVIAGVIFPSVSAGWVLSKEDFFASSNAVSFLKIRGMGDR